jgi:hypothetical protein
MARRGKVLVESKYMEPVSKEAEFSFAGATVQGRLLNLAHAEVALLIFSPDPKLRICDPVTSFSYHLELLDADGSFVARPSGSPTAWAELGDPVSQQSA